MGTAPLKIAINLVYREKCYGMATHKTCPHEASARINISATQQRGRLSNGPAIALEFSRPQAVAIRRDCYSSPAED